MAAAMEPNELLAARARGAVTAFLRASACGVDASDAVERMALDLRRVFIQAPFRLAWQDGSDTVCWHVQATGRPVQEPLPEFVDTDWREAIEVGRHAIRMRGSSPNFSGARVRLTTCGAECLITADAPDTAARQLFARTPELLLVIDALAAVIQAQNAARAAADAVSKREATSRADQLRRDVLLVISDVSADDDLLARISRVSDIVRGKQEARSVAPAIATWLVQELLSTGWPGRELHSRANTQTDTPLSKAIEALLGILGVTEASGGMTCESPGDPLGEAALRTLAALLDQPCASPSEATDVSLTRALPLWTLHHGHLRTQVELPVGGAPNRTQAADKKEVQSGLTALWREVEAVLRLRRSAGRGKKPAYSESQGRRSPRAVTALWFCLHTLDQLEAQERREPSPGATRVEADLAFVIRECVRFLCLGRRRDYHMAPAPFAVSLANVVRAHAERLLGLSPHYEIAELLQRLGRIEGLNRGRQATRHLLHVLDVYMAGQLLLGTAVPPLSADGHDQSEGPPLLADLLAEGAAAQRGGPAGLALRRAYALAALFHDVGYLLFPSSLRPEPALARGDATLRAGFEHVSRGMTASSRALIEPALLALGAPPYCSEREDALARWLRGQGQASHPDHGVLSAYYLHQVCARASAAGVSEPTGVSGSGLTVTERAVRAVLLHSAATVPVSVDADPVASVLVFVNELFDWDPERALGSAPSDVGRTFHQRQVDLSPLEHQARSLLVHLDLSRDGLKAEDVASGAVRAEAAAPWRFDYTLHRPEHLEAPAYHTWLLKAQRLGRLRGRRGVWPPALALLTPPDERVKPWESLRELLDAVTPNLGSPLRGALEAWLHRLSPGSYASPNDDHIEALVLDERTAFDPAVDLNLELRELDHAIDALVRSQQALGAPARPRRRPPRR
jgi:hypothetical protein